MLASWVSLQDVALLQHQQSATLALGQSISDCLCIEVDYAEQGQACGAGAHSLRTPSNF